MTQVPVKAQILSEFEEAWSPKAARNKGARASAKKQLEPTPAALQFACSKYKEHAIELQQLAADILEVKIVRREDPELDDEEHLISMGSFFFRNPNRPADAPNSLSELAARKKTDLATVAERMNESRGLFGNIDRGLVVPAFPDPFIDCLAEAMGCEADEVRDAIAGSIAKRRLGHLAAVDMPDVDWLHFEDLARGQYAKDLGATETQP